MDNANLHPIQNVSPNANKVGKNLDTKAPDDKEKKSKGAKSLKLALTGLAVLGTAAAAGVMIYRGRGKSLQNLGDKVQQQAAAQIQQAAQAVQKSEVPKVPPVAEELTSVDLSDIQTAALGRAEEFSELLKKKDELTPTGFRRLADLIQNKTEEEEAEIARILSEKTEAEASRRSNFLNRAIRNWNHENDEYIEKISSYTDEQYEIVETLLRSKTKGIGEYYRKNPEELVRSRNFSTESLGKIKDKERLRKIFCIVSKDKGVELKDAIKYSTFDDTMFERTSALADRGLGSLVMFDDRIKALQELDEKQFARILNIADGGTMITSEMVSCAKLDDKAYEKALLLCDKYGFDVDGVSKIAQLPDEEFQKVLERMQAGVPAWKAKDFGDEKFENFQYLMSKGVDKDAIFQITELSDRTQCEAFLERYKKSPQGINAEDLDNPEIRTKIIDKINSQYGYEVLKPDCTIEDIAWLWREKYVEGGWLAGGYSSSCIDTFLEKAMSRYEIQDGEKLGRWMRRCDLYKYIQDFPEVGETYAPGRIQSFAKTLEGAERYRGNNFSDTNFDMNVKMVVTPKAKLTKAFDVGEGKYGADEVIYGATQKFEVLKKGFEFVTRPDGRKHRQYVIYLQEL